VSASKKGLPLPNGQTPPDRTTRWLVPVLCLALAVGTFAVFGQTLHHDFVNFDDNEYVYDNPVVARGLTSQGIVWAFTQSYAANWHPLTWLSHELDCQLYGLHPGGHHLTNVLLHATTAILLFLVLRQMTGALWRSAFVAAVFAVHPLRVESVAWVAERKDILSGLFFMLTMAAYVRYARLPGSRGRYCVVMLLFALGLMCKPMLVTLPLVLLLLDYWPLQRVESVRRLALEKLPLLALSAAACVLTLWAQHESIQSTGLFTLPHRLGNAMVACAVYLGQMVWPAGLAVLYPYPQNGLPIWKWALAGILLASLSAVAWAGRRRRPWLLMGWAWYLLMLIPVAGIIQVGDQAHADRYTYLPQIGIYMAVTWLVAQWRVSRMALGCLMSGVLAVLMVCAWRQTAYWQDSETLWNRALACTKANVVAHDDLGAALRDKGRVDEAITQYQMALQINPNYAEAHYNLGIALVQKGKAAEASSHYQEAVRIQPANVNFQNNLAWLMATSTNAALRNGHKAVDLAQRASELSGGADPVILDTLAAALAEAGKFDDAKRIAQKALELARAAGQQDLVKELNSELKLYEAGRPCRD
jgi:tetratricopeptide (TPR) repeat protein